MKYILTLLKYPLIIAAIIGLMLIIKDVSEPPVDKWKLPANSGGTVIGWKIDTMQPILDTFPIKDTLGWLEAKSEIK